VGLFWYTKHTPEPHGGVTVSVGIIVVIHDTKQQWDVVVAAAAILQIHANKITFIIITI